MRIAPINIPYRENVYPCNYRKLYLTKVNIYGIKINFYSKNAYLIRFIERNFSLAKHLRLDDDRHKLLNLSLEIILKIKKDVPSIKELYAIEHDANALIADALWSKCAFFHASCVASLNDYLLFLGPSMAGKSTIATYLSKRGFTLLADDDSVLRYDSLRPVFFPSFRNRKANDIFLSKDSEKVKDIISYLYYTPDTDFRRIYDLEACLYKNKFDINDHKRLNFIFIKGQRDRKPRLEVADKMDPKTIQCFFKFTETPQEKRNKKISEMMDLYTKSNMYFLIKGTVRDTIDLILKKFK